jgi:hypothetical protein
MTDQWKEQLTNITREIFSGQPEGLHVLDILMTNGKLLDAEQPASLEIERAIERAFWGVLIPAAWDATETHPVLIDTEKPCNAIGVGNYDWVTPRDAAKSSICVGDRRYQLLSVKGSSCIMSGSGRNQVCKARTMTPPAGLERLNGEDLSLTGRVRWGGITMQDLAERFSNIPTSNLIE